MLPSLLKRWKRLVTKLVARDVRKLRTKLLHETLAISHYDDYSLNFDRIIAWLLDQRADPNGRTRSGATSLMVAASVPSNGTDVLQKLIESRANVNAVDYDGFTALQLLSSDPDLDCDLPNNYCESTSCFEDVERIDYLLWPRTMSGSFASSRSDCAVDKRLTLLLDARAFVDNEFWDFASWGMQHNQPRAFVYALLDDEQVCTGTSEPYGLRRYSHPPSYAGRGSLATLGECRDEELQLVDPAEFVESLGPCLDYADDDALSTPLHWAAAVGHDFQLLEAMLDAGADINARNGEGHTVLWELLALCRPRTWIELCLAHGAVVYDEDLVVAVVQAFVNSSFSAGLDAVKLLLQRGANVNGRGPGWGIQIDGFAAYQRDVTRVDDLTPLGAALLFVHHYDEPSTRLQMVKRLLGARADVEQPIAGATPLQHALEAPSLGACHLGAPRVELCVALIAAGATIPAAYTPLQNWHLTYWALRLDPHQLLARRAVSEYLDAFHAALLRRLPQFYWRSIQEFLV